MYPFFVLGLPEATSDAEVEARYHALVRQHPPDTDGEMFQIIRKAYEAIKTEPLRARVRLFHFDATGDAVAKTLLRFLESARPTRMSEADFVRFLKAARR